MKTAHCSSDDWIKPEDMEAWQLLMYRKNYNAGYNSYHLHYKAAVSSGNRISVARMEWTVNAVALARIRGTFK